MPDVRFVTCAAPPVPDTDTPRLARSLSARGCTVAIDAWTDRSVEWADAAVTVLRSPWDYVDHLDDFVAWADRAASVSALWNPAALVRWNTHKAYLLELSSAGVLVVPTVLLPCDSAAALDGIADARGWNAFVVKPAVAVGALGAGRYEVGSAAGQAHLDALLQAGDVLVQPYASEIEEAGELSVLLVDGERTHAVRKTPRAGEFRIHERYGGAIEPAEVPGEVAALSTQAVGVLPAPALYGRVDVVSIGGRWHVLEVEVTEPRLYLELGPPEATERLVDAIIARLG